MGYDDQMSALWIVLISGIIVLGVAVIAVILGCIHASKIKRHKAFAYASPSIEKGLQPMVVQGTVIGLDGQPIQHQIQVHGPFFMTSQRGPNGEELVMVPQRLLTQFQQQQQALHQQQQQQQQQLLQQQQQNQGQYQLPPAVPLKSTTYLPQGLQQGAKAQVEDQHEQYQQPQPNLNTQAQPTEPKMSQRKFEKSIKVEGGDDGGAGVGAGSGVVVVHEEPSSSSSNKTNE